MCWSGADEAKHSEKGHDVEKHVCDLEWMSKWLPVVAEEMVLVEQVRSGGESCRCKRVKYRAGLVEGK